jgi:hypothetical protein
MSASGRQRGVQRSVDQMAENRTKQPFTELCAATPDPVLPPPIHHGNSLDYDRIGTENICFAGFGVNPALFDFGHFYKAAPLRLGAFLKPESK